MNCTTHHSACDCREAAIAELIKAKDREIRALKIEIGILRAETGFEIVIDGRDDPATATRCCRNCGAIVRDGQRGPS